jgi:acyl-CoA synthetase (AMP-forming)/AMP-acid ligase II
MRARISGFSQQACLYEGGRWFRYADLDAAIDAWDPRLAALGLPAGSVVGVRADYSIDAVGLLFAAWARGHVVALVPGDGDVDARLADACAGGMFVGSEGGHLEWRRGPAHSDHPLLETLRREGGAGVVIFTSGSSGRPKAALHSVERFLRKFDDADRPFRTLAFLLFDHVAGLDTLFYTLAAGGSLVTTRARDPRTICALVASTRIEVLPASPSFLRLLCASGEAAAHDLSSLSIVTYGSEPMDQATLRGLNGLFPTARIRQKYGTTETGAPRTISRGNDSLWVKLVGEGVETRVVDGMLWIRGPGTLLGYLNSPSPLAADGWYCTGDLCEVDGEWIHVLGRQSDMINVGGEKVSPVEVEQVILELEMVAEAAVSGRAHPLMGQVVTARVTLTKGADAGTAERRIRKHCLSRLARYKVPMAVDVVDAPLSSARQKTLRQSS